MSNRQLFKLGFAAATLVFIVAAAGMSDVLVHARHPVVLSFVFALGITAMAGWIFRMIHGGE